MANTPFLDLVKPAGTDHALVSVINSNSDKIDGGVSTLSEHLVTFVNAKIKAVTLEKTVNSGYFTIDVESEFGSGYIPCMVMTVYKSGTVSSQLNLCYTLDSSNVYVRTGSGEQLANGTVIKVSVMAIKMIS